GRHRATAREPRADAARRDETGRMTAPARILVVDDDASARRLTHETLAKAGFHVIEAGDGKAALEAVAGELPDLVLMDVSMPLMDGFDACAALRRLPGGNRVPIAMMTG